MITIFRNKEDEAIYAQGFIDYDLKMLDKADSFHAAAEWLENKPGALTLNTKDWSVNEELTVATYRKGTEDEEIVPINLVLLFDPKSDSNEVILHSLKYKSFFFLVKDNGTLEALYVD